MYGMGMSMGLSQSLHIEMTQRLTMEQSIIIQQRMFRLRMELIHTIRDERYLPIARCPSCQKNLTPINIMKGFNRNPSDFTTKCPRCKNRFLPSLICTTEGLSITLPFFCPCQVLDQLQGKETLHPDKLAREHPAIYRSAIVHHGSIRNAFKKIGAEYLFEDISDWKQKIKPFLGKLPDSQVARCVNASASSIRLMRMKLKIKKFSRKKLLK